MKISGYSKFKKVNTDILEFTNCDDLIEGVKNLRKTGRKFIVRGSGLSYGDTGYLENGVTLTTSKLNQIIYFDPARREITVESGVTLKEIISYIFDFDLTLHIQPGHHGITVGGAISSDVHGKNCFKSGYFSENIVWIEILNENSELQVLTQKELKNSNDSPIGMYGLASVITKVCLRLTQLQNKKVRVKRTIVNDINQLKDEVLKLSENEDYIVVWLDTFSPSPPSWIRCYIESAIDLPDWQSEVVIKSYLNERNFFYRFLISSLIYLISLLPLKRQIIQVHNKVHFLLVKNGKKSFITSFGKYNYKHFSIPNFYNIYGAHGFFEIQPFIPVKNFEQCLTELLLFCKQFKVESYLCGIKLHRPSLTDTLPKEPTFSIGLDFKSGLAKNTEFVNELIRIITRNNGSFYLAKDSILSHEDINFNDNQTFKNHLECDSTLLSSFKFRITSKLDD
jgi:decaprenylphospho-beta-D-ribofuranose 2-oxidase